MKIEILVFPRKTMYSFAACSRFSRGWGRLLKLIAEHDLGGAYRVVAAYSIISIDLIFIRRVIGLCLLSYQLHVMRMKH